MKQQRFSGGIAGVGAVLLCLLTACSGGITTLLPIDMNLNKTTPTTASAKTTDGSTTTTTYTTITTETTTTTTLPPLQPWSMYNPDPVMSFEEYMSEMRRPGDDEKFYDLNQYFSQNQGVVFVYQPQSLYWDAEEAFGLQIGNIYCWNGKPLNEQDFRLLQDCHASTYSSTTHMGYTYIAVDGTVYRYKSDGTDETLIFKSDLPILSLTCDSYAMFFATDEGIYRFFRPTGQLDRICDYPMEQSGNINMATNDILSAYPKGEYSYYILSLNRWVRAASVERAYDKPLYTREFYLWLYTYCENHPN